MAGSIAEASVSRKSTDGDEPSAELKFAIKDTFDDSEARLLLLSEAPTFWSVGGKTLVQKQRSVEEKGGGIWVGTVTYGRKKKEKETGESSYQFEIGGGSVHITEALYQWSYAPPAKTAPEMNRRVAVVRSNGEIDVQGLDIVNPTYSWSETHYLPIAVVTPAYKAVLFAVASAPVNNAAWRGFAAGEVLFKGASGQQRGEEDWAITYKFEASQNQDDITIDDITGIIKKGWEYLWVLYQDAVDTNKHLIKKAQAVYVAKVYGLSDFALLGLGS